MVGTKTSDGENIQTDSVHNMDKNRSLTSTSKATSPGAKTQSWKQLVQNELYWQLMVFLFLLLLCPTLDQPWKAKHPPDQSHKILGFWLAQLWLLHANHLQSEHSWSSFFFKLRSLPTLLPSLSLFWRPVMKAHSLAVTNWTNSSVLIPVVFAYFHESFVSFCYV